MIKLSFSKPVYRIYNKGRITRCTYHCKVVSTLEYYPLAEFDVTAESRCHTSDTPIKDKGIMLADSRAKAMAYAMVRDTYTHCEICELKNKIIAYQGIIDFYNKVRYLKQQEDKHVNWLLHANFPIENENKH